MAAGNISIRFKANGISENIVSACATGTSSIGEAFLKIRDGYQDIILQAVRKHQLHLSDVAGFTTLRLFHRILTLKRQADLLHKNRDGFDRGDGACLMLEEMEHA